MKVVTLDTGEVVVAIVEEYGIGCVGLVECLHCNKVDTVTGDHIEAIAYRMKDFALSHKCNERGVLQAESILRDKG